MATANHRSRRLRVAVFLGVGLATTGIALVAYGTHAFNGFELSSIDKRFSVRGKQKRPNDVAVVAIDAKTFNDLQTQWPFARGDYHAQVIDNVHRAGAKVIAIDIQFSEPSTDFQDNRLIDVVANAKNVVLATTEVDEERRGNVFGGNIPPGAEVGNALLKTGTGDVLRKIRYQVQFLTSFSVIAAEFMTGHGVKPFSEDRWIDYRGPPRTIPTYSYSDVWNMYTPGRPNKIPPSAFKDKIVVIGPAAPSLGDVHPTPLGENMAGVEIQANSIWTVLHDFPLRSVPGWFTILSIIALGLLPPLASMRFNLFWTLAIVIPVGVLYVVATQVAFNNGWVVSFVYPFLALALSGVGSLGAHYLLAAFERERVRDVFSRFVPESVVEQVLARTDDDLRLGGVSVVGTIMFTDLRGFTTFSESLPADQVIEALNIYLEEMTEVVLEHEGTLVSYEGDGMMAVWGAPIEQPDHADRAIAAAREMLVERLPRWNAWLRERKLSPGFKMGIGLNTGSFMSGNVGSERRLEYTVIGDTTNTASRLQGLTKGQPYLLFMADSTREALTEGVDDLVFVDEFDVRGRQETVKIWSIEAANSAAFDAHEAAAVAAEAPEAAPEAEPGLAAT